MDSIYELDEMDFAAELELEMENIEVDDYDDLPTGDDDYGTPWDFEAAA